MENNPTWVNASQKAKMYGHLTGNLAAVENVWGSEWNNAVGKSAFLSKALDSEGSWCARQTKVSMSYGLRLLVTRCFIFLFHWETCHCLMSQARLELMIFWPQHVHLSRVGITNLHHHVLPGLRMSSLMPTSGVYLEIPLKQLNHCMPLHTWNSK